MTTTHTTRLDQCPPGLVHVAAHGEIPGGLAYVDQPGQHLYGLTGPMWSIRGDDLADYEGVPLTWVPTSVAEESPDPRVVAYANDQKRASNTEFSA